MPQIPNTPSSAGPFKYLGEDYSWTYEPVQDVYEVSFMGHTTKFPPHVIQSDPFAVRDWANAIYQTKKGSAHGISGQSTQTISGNSTGTLAGMQQGTFSGYAEQFQNAAATAAAINAQHQQQLAYQQQQYNQWQQRAFGQAQGVRPSTPAASKPLKTEGFKLGEIIGWRGWRVTQSGFLRSMSADVIWPPDEPMDGKTKSAEEHNGVYAYKKAKDFLHEFSEDGRVDIYGKVALWGDIIEHELGYRAEFAKVVSLDHFLKREAPYKIGIKDLRERYKLAA